MKPFKFYSDPGHGWLAVKRKLLRDLNIIDKISQYSYQRGKTVYLEEDRDSSIFFQAYQKKYGEKPTYIEKIYDGVHPIRSYDDFENIDWSGKETTPFKKISEGVYG